LGVSTGKKKKGGKKRTTGTSSLLLLFHQRKKEEKKILKEHSEGGGERGPYYLNLLCCLSLRVEGEKRGIPRPSRKKKNGGEGKKKEGGHHASSCPNGQILLKKKKKGECAAFGGGPKGERWGKRRKKRSTWPIILSPGGKKGKGGGRHARHINFGRKSRKRTAPLPFQGGRKEGFLLSNGGNGEKGGGGEGRWPYPIFSLLVGKGKLFPKNSAGKKRGGKVAISVLLTICFFFKKKIRVPSCGPGRPSRGGEKKSVPGKKEKKRFSRGTEGTDPKKGKKVSLTFSSSLGKEEGKKGGALICQKRKKEGVLVLYLMKKEKGRLFRERGKGAFFSVGQKKGKFWLVREGKF